MEDSSPCLGFPISCLSSHFSSLLFLLGLWHITPDHFNTLCCWPLHPLGDIWCSLFSPVPVHSLCPILVLTCCSWPLLYKKALSILLETGHPVPVWVYSSPLWAAGTLLDRSSMWATPLPCLCSDSPCFIFPCMDTLLVFVRLWHHAGG